MIEFNYKGVAMFCGIGILLIAVLAVIVSI